MVDAEDIGTITIRLPHESADIGRDRLERLATTLVPGQRVVAIVGRWHGVLGWAASEWEVWRSSGQVGAVQIGATQYAFRKNRAVSLVLNAA